MVRIFWFLSVLLLDIILIQHNYAVVQGSDDVDQDGSENFFDDFIAPIVKYGMMSSGNKTENEANDILNTISTAVKDREATKASSSASQVKNEGSSDVSKKGTFFQDFIAPIIRHGMMNSGNVTEKETDNILNIFSPGIPTPTDYESSAKTNPFKSESFFQDFIVPVIHHGMITSGNKTEAEADAILDIISANVKNTEEQSESGSTNSDLPDASSTRLFSDYLAPIIKYGLLNPGSNPEDAMSSEADKISLESDNSIESPLTDDEQPAADSDIFFQRFIAPIIKHGMMTNGNKTESEADAIVNIIISSQKNKSPNQPFDSKTFPSEVATDKTKAGNFFQTYIAPMLKYKMTTTGNKTEEEANAILNMISSSMKTAAAYSTDDTDPSNSVTFFQDFIAPIISHGILSFGKKSKSEADAILETISSDINSRAETAVSDKTPEQHTSVAEDAPSKSGIFFQKFIAPMIRYGMINSGNKTEEEADAILNVISGGNSISKEAPKETKGNFFQDFVAPIIRNRLMVSDMRNESEADSIMNVITSAVKSKEGAKVEGSVIENGSELNVDQIKQESDQETDTVVNYLIMPEVDDVISEAISSPDAETTDGPIENDVSNKEATEQLKSDILKIVDSNLEASSENEKSAFDQSKASDSTSDSDTSDGKIDSVDFLIKSKLVPALNEKITSLKTLANFFSHPTILSGLRDSFRNAAMTIRDSNTDVGTSGTDESGQTDVSDTPANSLGWFVYRVITPEIQKQMARFDTLTDCISKVRTDTLPDSVNTALSKFRSMFPNYRQDDDEDDDDESDEDDDNGREGVDNEDDELERDNGEERTGKERKVDEAHSETQGAAFFKNIIVPKLKKEALAFKTVASKFSTVDGRKAMSSAVEEFVDKAMQSKSEIAALRKTQNEKYYKRSESDGVQTASGFVGESIDEARKQRSKVSAARETLRSKMSGLKSSLYDQYRKGYDTRISKRSADLGGVLSVPESSETIDGFVDEVLMPVFEKKAKIMKKVAGKFENPKKVDEIVDTVKSRIKTMVERKKNALCKDTSCEEKIRKAKAYDSLKPEDFVKQIVQLKMKIAKDRVQIRELEKQIDKHGPHTEKLDLISAQSKLIKDIKESYIALEKSFRDLRKEKESFYMESSKISMASLNNGNGETLDYAGKVTKTIDKINSLRNEISQYGPQISVLEKKLGLEFDFSKRLALESEKFELLGKLKTKSIQLSSLYKQLRIEKEAMRKAQYETYKWTPGQPKSTYEMDFTEEEKAQYAGLLGELNYAVDTDGGDSESSTPNTTFLIVGLTVAVSGTVVLGLLLYRRRHGKHRLYTRIPNESNMGTSILVNDTDTYGSCTNSMG